MGLVMVLCQRGQSVWLHTHSDLKKIVVCRVKLFELVSRDELKESVPAKDIMLED